MEKSIRSDDDQTTESIPLLRKYIFPPAWEDDSLKDFILDLCKESKQKDPEEHFDILSYDDPLWYRQMNSRPALKDNGNNGAVRVASIKKSQNQQPVATAPNDCSKIQMATFPKPNQPSVQPADAIKSEIVKPTAESNPPSASQNRQHQVKGSVQEKAKAVSLTVPPSQAGLPNVPFGRNKNQKIKRPMNAFMLWARIHRPIIKNAFPRATFKDIGEKLGMEWAKLSMEEQQPYYEEAFKIKKKHEDEFPDWQYQPNIRKRKTCSCSNTNISSRCPNLLPLLSNSINILQAIPTRVCKLVAIPPTRDPYYFIKEQSNVLSTESRAQASSVASSPLYFNGQTISHPVILSSPTVLPGSSSTFRLPSYIQYYLVSGCSNPSSGYNTYSAPLAVLETKPVIEIKRVQK
ncbi:uncharacterized protein [Pyxicephalus adspersus]|uniref:HMG box domain-containing protein n=1 Tax=Pyxicephalus adspersus TaxID=30357 RepID=A0AAV3ATW1_PYXAD|nr:TPA: hypothetical protein GDO54_006583 [Pyxicephalus adspersus]